MVARAMKKVDPVHQVKYNICDALEYLKDCPKYDITTSSWVIHNFPWSYKKELFKAIYEKTAKAFYLMDKVYPAFNPKDKLNREMLDRQLKRYECLPEETRKAIVRHEEEDATEEFLEVSLPNMPDKDYMQNCTTLALEK